VNDKNKKVIADFLKGTDKKLVINQPVPVPAGVGVVRKKWEARAIVYD
jgi:hypothetical protein